MAAASHIYQVAVPTPLYGVFDYLYASILVPGQRVRVPFGHRELTGIVVREIPRSELPPNRIKTVIKALDTGAIFPESMLGLLRWAANYYHHPLGEVLHTAMPAHLRIGAPASIREEFIWTLTQEGKILELEKFSRASIQKHLYEALTAAPDGLDAKQLARVSRRWTVAIKAMQQKGWVIRQHRSETTIEQEIKFVPLTLNAAQKLAVSTVVESLDRFQVHLLHGVTGSGKTEVYLNAVQQVLAKQRQALILVPEISLTPQVVERFQQRFHVPMALLHSGLSDLERANAWLAAREGKARVVLGTRSAVFTPLANPGLIVVDEEHDTSYKQQDGFRYSARDVAVMRASLEKIPIVLGSATPSLESLKKARDGAYTLLELPDRTGGAGMPTVRMLDMRQLKPSEGLSPPMRDAIADRLERGEQSILFLNRRGFAPVWMCYDCGWVAPCRRCDAQLTLHRQRQKLLCHHCGAEQEIIPRCLSCHGGNLHPLGEGTERIEVSLQKFFPKARIERIDRDSTQRRGALEAKLRLIQDGKVDILVGTQLLAKGHDFPNVTLVGILNADQGLYGMDFRSGERMFHLIMQVSGRAGRADKPGEVLIQTWHPGHPMFAAMQRHDFHGFANFALSERRDTRYPPYTHLALLRAESPAAGEALKFLHEARLLAKRLLPEKSVTLLDPIPAPMERRAGRYRAQLLVQAAARAPLHGFLGPWVTELAEAKFTKKVRWSLDVDPADMY